MLSEATLLPPARDLNQEIVKRHIMVRDVLLVQLLEHKVARRLPTPVWVANAADAPVVISLPAGGEIQRGLVSDA